MKKSFLRMRKIPLPTLLALVLSMVIVLGGMTSPTSAITQMNPTTTVYLDPPTINGTAIAEEFRVDMNIRDSPNMTGWKAGVTFNATLLQCIGFDEGGFLSSAGLFLWKKTINNTLGVLTAECTLLMGAKTSGDGRLAYATFRVIATGVSDLHLRDVQASDWIDSTEIMIPINIIDVYTVVVDATPYTVVTVSNSTGKTAEYGSGFYDHAFIPGEELRFNVTGPYPGFSNVTVPETLMSGALDGWNVTIDGTPLSTEERTVTSNDTHYSVYFTYSEGNHAIQITSPYVVPEFPTVILTPLLFILTLIAVFLGKRLWSKKRRGRPTAR